MCDLHRVCRAGVGHANVVETPLLPVDVLEYNKIVREVRRTLRSTPALPRASFSVATSVESTLALLAAAVAVAVVAVFGTGVVTVAGRVSCACMVWAVRGVAY